MIYDLAILGGGPAGVSAGVYSARKKLKTIFLTKDFGGQSTVSTGIENWIGTVKIPGTELAENLKKHLLAYAGDSVHIKEGSFIEKISGTLGNFKIKTSRDEFEAKTVLITTGSHRRKIEAVNADKFEHKGITYCASCDGPIFAGQEVLVYGGGNAAFETSAQLLAYCPKVYLATRGDKFRADPTTVEKVSAHPNITILKNSSISEFKGNQFLESVILVDSKTRIKKELSVSGVFAEIGSVPSTEFAKDLVKLNEFGQIVTDPKNQRTSVSGIWSAGDCTDCLYHQNNIASGDGVKALEDIYLFLNAK